MIKNIIYSSLQQERGTGIVFYTENNDIIKEFNLLIESDNIQNVKKFLHDHYDCIDLLKHFKKLGLTSMECDEQVAFDNLLTKEEIKETLANFSEEPSQEKGL